MISYDYCQVFLEICISTCQGGDFKSIFYPKQLGIKSPPQKKTGKPLLRNLGNPWIQRFNSSSGSQGVDKPLVEVCSIKEAKVEMMTTGNQQQFIVYRNNLSTAAGSKI